MLHRLTARVPCTPLYIERELFTAQQVLAVQQLALADAQMAVWLGHFRAASQIDPADPELLAGTAALVQLGIITGQRRAEILAEIARGMPRN